ncbi:hypothetical protein NC653_031488 [Populus alba x Populus x berolinensis]|uniref:Uncharacterized protein n=1 Tax=Populus alba x Populus x berolinensis TaxID=444605 RepID=A0AAD6LYM0_9ROSI|nr:hypothetical protein NC653_031488 [Populus alba x Populus x berolinensis]
MSLVRSAVPNASTVDEANQVASAWKLASGNRTPSSTVLREFHDKRHSRYWMLCRCGMCSSVKQYASQSSANAMNVLSEHDTFSSVAIHAFPVFKSCAW